MRGGEPCVPDRLEDRTPISCEWAEKEHTGRRAEPKAEGDAPGIAFSRRGSRRSAAAEANLRAKWRSSVPSSSSLRAPRRRQRGFEYGAGVPVRIPCIAGGCPYLRARFHHTNHPCQSFRINRGLRPPAFRLPREGRQLPGSRGAFHRLESMCTGLAPSAFIDRSSDHAGALLIGYPFP